MGKVGKIVVGGILFVGGLAIGIYSGQWYVAAALMAQGAGMVWNAAQGERALSERQAVGLENRADSKAGIPVIYGETRIGPVIVDVRVDTNSYRRRRMAIVCAWCHGSSDGSGIEAIDKIWLDDRLAWTSGGGVQEPFDRTIYTGLFGDPYQTKHLKVTNYLGTESQVVDPDLNAIFPTEWPSTSKGLGVAYSVLLFWFNEDIHGGGIPRINAEIRGANVLDPRTSLTSYKTNPALAIYDFITAPVYGWNEDAAILDSTTFEAAADYCDELVTPFSGSGTQKRFELAGWVETAASIQATLGDLSTSCRATVLNIGGVWKLFIRQETTNTGLEITPSNTIEGSWKYLLPGNSDAPNSIAVNYIDVDRGYQVDTVHWPEPSASNAYLAEDRGYEHQIQIDLPFTTNRLRAQQIGMVVLKEARSSIVVTLTAKEELLQAEVGDLLYLTNPSPNWDQKEFWVAATNYRPFGEAVMDMILVEYDSTVYSVDNEQESQPPVDPIDPPDPWTPDQPDSLYLVAGDAEAVVTADGIRTARIQMTWTPSPDPYLHHYEIQAKRADDSIWDSYGTAIADDNVFFVGPVDSGVEWDTRVRAVTRLGMHSDWIEDSIIPNVTGASLVVPSMEIEGTAPALTFLETDQSFPYGLWRWQLEGDIARLQQNTAVAGDFSTVDEHIIVNPDGSVSLAGGNFDINASGEVIDGMWLADIIDEARGGLGADFSGIAQASLLQGEPGGGGFQGLEHPADGGVYSLQASGSSGTASLDWVSGTVAHSLSGASHSGELDIAQLGGEVPEGIIRVDAAGTQWEVYNSGSVGDFLMLTDTSPENTWAARTLQASDIPALSYIGGSTTNMYIPYSNGVNTLADSPMMRVTSTYILATLTSFYLRPSTGAVDLRAYGYQDNPSISGYRAEGDVGSPTPTLASTLLRWTSYGYDGSSWSQGAQISFISGATWDNSPAEHSAYMSFYTRDGAGSLTARWTIQADGDLVPDADSQYDIGTNTVRPATIYADSFNGAGGSITGLNANNITSGIVNLANGGLDADYSAFGEGSLFVGKSGGSDIEELPAPFGSGDDDYSLVCTIAGSGTTALLVWTASAAPVHTLSGGSHSGELSITQLGDEAPEGIIRVDVTGDQWEVYSGGSPGDFLMLTDTSPFATWAARTLVAGDIPALAYAPVTHTHDANDWDALTWTQYGIVYANGTASLTSTAVATTGAMVYAPNATSWAILAAASSGNVLLSGTTPSWGKVTSSHTTGTFSPSAHTHPVTNLDGAVPEAIIRSTTVGSAWEVYNGGATGNVLKLTSAASNDVWAAGQVDWSELSSKPSTFPPSSHDHPASDIVSGALALARGGLAHDYSALGKRSLFIGTSGGGDTDELLAPLASGDGDYSLVCTIGASGTTADLAWTASAAPVHSMSGASHTGAINISQIGEAAPEGILRVDVAGTAWELYNGGSTGNFLMLTGGGANDVWAAHALTAADVAAGAFPGSYSIAGVLTQVSSRPITIGASSGWIKIKGQAGGWAVGTMFLGSSDTDRGGFGCYGTDDAFNYFYLGVYSTGELAKFAASLATFKTAANFDAAVTMDTTLDVTGLTTLGRVRVTGQSYPDEVYQAGTGTTVTINWNNGNVQQYNMSGNCTINIDSGSNMFEGAAYTLIVHGHTSNTYTLQINGVTADMWIGADYSSATNHPNDTVSVFQFQKVRNRADTGNLVYAMTSIDQAVALA